MSRIRTSDAERDNDKTFMNYYNRLTLLATSIFEWSGLPDKISQRYVEKVLYHQGKILFFDDPNFGFMCLKCTPSGQLNPYEEPIEYTVNTVGYPSRTWQADDSVIVRDNYLMYPIEGIIIDFAERLTLAERTIDININAQKTPWAIATSEKNRLTILNAYKQIQTGEPVVIYDKSLDINALKVLNTNAPFVAGELQDYKHQIMNECLTFLGVNNANTDKRERLIKPEVESNNQNVGLSLQTRLLTRLEACEKINKKYGLNVSVKIRDFNLLEGEEKEEIENE